MIYVHVPFCRSFCIYCGFYSEIACSGRFAGAVRAYADGVVEEIGRRRGEIACTAGTNTLYIGGGTPSVLPLDVLGRIVKALGPAEYEEFTIEVNPDDVTGLGRGYLEGLRSLGVNRVSMGVQSLDDGILRWMNRRHDADGAAKAFRMLRDAGFDNVSLDLIFGVNGLSDTMLLSTLELLKDWRPEHVSAYQLSVEEDSALAGMIAGGRYQELDDESCRRQYDMICSFLRSAGYDHYEISNWSLPGFRARHNSAYWTRAPYVGLGPGAHSLRIDGDVQVRSWNSNVLSGWTSSSEVLTDEEIREERLMLGLRTSSGVDGMAIPESSWFVADDIISGMI